MFLLNSKNPGLKGMQYILRYIENPLILILFKGLIVKRLLIMIYEFSLWIMALIIIPKMFYHFFVHRKYRKSFLARLGIRYPMIPIKRRPVIWIHAVSIGETKAVVSLAREIKKILIPCELIISSITETGHAEAKKSIPFADHHVYLPFDFSFTMRKILGAVSPNLVILCESDFWFNFLRFAKSQGARIALVNGKLSEKSTNRFRRFSFFSKPLFDLFDVLCIQNQLYQERFISVGASPDRLVMTGNLKLDEDYPKLSPEEVDQWRERLGISSQHIVLTIGSTHDPEERIFIEKLKKIWVKNPHLKVILVPRHPERFKVVLSLLKKEEISFICFTEIEQRTGKEKVLFIDTMGLLRMCYQLADIALVGGSFTEKVGGHNILEPCWYGKPVIFGPYMQTQFELVEMIKQYQAGVQVDKAGLEPLLEEWLKDNQARIKIGKQGIKLVTDLKGAAKTTIQALSSTLIEIKKSF
jgi:3-deoxy-D-manno-octulosonic-acid transferase